MLLIVTVALGGATGCTDNPVSPSAVRIGSEPFQNRLVYRPAPDNMCVPRDNFASCTCSVPCGQLPPPRRHSRFIRR